MNRSKLETIYSIGVLVAIPVIVITNTVLLISNINFAFDQELQRKAAITNNIIAQSSVDLIENQDFEKISANLNSFEESQPAIMQSMLIVRENDELKIAARSASAPETIGKEIQIGIEIAFNNKQVISSRIDTTDRKSNNAQAWNTETPVISNNKVIAVISTSFLTVDAQETIDQAYKTSILILAISIILIIAMLFRHFRLVGYAQLLTKQKELNQTMSDFLSVATHELKSPTTIIKGYLSNVIEGDFGEVTPEIKEQIQIALSQTDRLNSLVQDLLNVSRVEQGRIEYKFSAVDTTKVIKTIVDNYRPIAEEKGLKLIYEPLQNLPLVRADEGRVQEVFTNLIDNAIKYTAEGSVTIEQRDEKGYLITNIRDTGFGMSPEAKDRLFQRFYRIKTDKTQGISGTGLGLWIIKQYIEAMNGTIYVESMENVGSNFIVRLEKNK